MGFKYILIGVAFTLYIPFLTNSVIPELDILPDFIGYIFMFMGLSIIKKFHVHFRIARFIAIPLILVSFIFFLDELFNALEIYNDIYFFILNNYLTLEIIYDVMMIAFAFFLFIGISQNASKFGYNFLAERAKQLFVLYVTFIAFTYVTLFNDSEVVYEVTNVILLVLGILVGTFELIVISQARQYLEE